MDKQNLITRIAKKGGLRARVNANCCECIYDEIDASSYLGSNDDSYQQAVYSPPNYKDLSSASNALDIAIGKFFDSCKETNYGE